MALKYEKFTPNDKGAKVFETYGINPDYKRNQKFRDERTPSFSIRYIDTLGNYGFNDFGNPDFKGVGFIKFIMLAENCSYKEAIQKAKAMYHEPDTYHASKPTRKPRSAQQAAKPKELTKIEFQEFNQEELDYWQSKGRVSLKTLTELNVKSVKMFSVFNPNTGATKEYYTKGFVFAFEIVKDKAYKLYMPKANYRVFGSAKTTFLPNLSTAKELDPEYSYHFGIDSLKENQSAILCEGEADCLAIREQGFNAFTLGNAITQIKPYVLAKLKSKNVEISAVIYDTDYTGLQASQRLSQGLSCKRIVLPKLPQQNSKQEPKPRQNDVCDYISLYGFDDDLLNLINNDLPLTIRERLAEIEPRLKNIIQQNSFISLKAPTGTGKTHTLIKSILPQLFNHSIFAVPTRLQSEQIEKEYTLDCLYSSKQVSQEYLAQSVLVCTYDKLSTVFSAQKVECVVIDEAHLLSDSYSYRAKAIKQIAQCVKLCQEQGIKVIYLSATPCKVLEAVHGSDLAKFEVKRTQNPIVKVRRYEYAKQPKKAILGFLSNLNFDTDKIYLTKVDSYKRASQIAKILVRLGLLKEDEIDFVFSEKRIQDKSDTAKEIEQTSKIGEGRRLIFCSKILDIGTNLNNQNLELVYATTKREQTRDLIQFVARARKMGEVNLHLLKRTDLEEPHKFDAVKEALSILELATAQSTLNNQFKKDPKYSKVIRNNSKLFENELITYDSENKTYNPNLQAIANNQNEVESKLLDNDQYYQILANQGFELSKIIALESELSREQEAISKEIQESQKQEIETFEGELAQQWAKSEQEREPILLDLSTNYESSEIAQRLQAPQSCKFPVPSIAKNSLQARSFIAFLEFISRSENLHIKRGPLQSKLFLAHNTSNKLTHLTTTLKNQILLRYDKTMLTRFTQKYDKQREVLEAIISTVQKIQVEQSLEYKNQISQAKRQKTLYENRLAQMIAESNRKTGINTEEQKRLDTLNRRIERLESYAMSFEVKAFARYVHLRLGNIAQDIKEKYLIEQIESLFVCDRKRELREGDRQEYIYIGKLRTFKENLLELSFDENEARQYLNNLDKLIKEEIEGLNAEQDAIKTANTPSKATKPSVLDLSKLPNKYLNNKINPSAGNTDKFMESFLNDKPNVCSF